MLYSAYDYIMCVLVFDSVSQLVQFSLAVIKKRAHTHRSFLCVVSNLGLGLRPRHEGSNIEDLPATEVRPLVRYIFLVCVTTKGIYSRLLCSKPRVAPLKALSIPIIS